MALANCVKRCRLDKGYSQEYMADSLCMSQPTYSRVEHNDRECEKKIDQLAAIFGISADALRTYTVNIDGSQDILIDSRLQQELMQHRAIIAVKDEEISFLRRQLDQLQSFLKTTLRGRG
ncbi:helix-turn-helix domain-containing protein [Fibrella aquatilis]|uniref:Helix-turn-helix transcriptional regulator n=1 Tax=Fibrella aquatilis TaxID=2817059 RepID=A0A939JYY9_9BACT|nr:helix-turn-helix transcriptional regulator [Fibrella aquatilis]MBO0932604.1 helix-turn-helix transcriptional regulator [Fibrella aquatilis]